jgi:hypothetical protein
MDPAAALIRNVEVWDEAAIRKGIAERLVQPRPAIRERPRNDGVLGKLTMGSGGRYRTRLAPGTTRSASLATSGAPDQHRDADAT